jgi:hypothetical protein
MTITFENNNDVVVYAFKKVIAYTKRTQQIFVAQCVWWLASIIGLEQGLIKYIDNIQTRQEVVVVPDKSPEKRKSIFPVPRDIQEYTRQKRILKECGDFLRDSKKLRAQESVNAKRWNRINRLASTKKLFRIKKERKLKDYSKTEGIDKAEIQRRKSEGVCLRCAWPSDRKGTHRVKDGIRPIKLHKGTASYPKGKEYQRIKQSYQQPMVEEVSTEESSSEESSDE